MLFFIRSLVLKGLLIGFTFIFLLNSNGSLADNNSNSMAKVPTKFPYLEINPETWNSKKDIKRIKSGRIDKLIDPLTILLKDGSIIRLASIDIPQNNNEDLAVEALSYLNKLLPEKTEIIIYQTRDAKSGRVNRMNHQLSHLVTKDKNIWIQGSLLSEGLARYYTAPDHDELLQDMQAAEETAIKSKKKLWAEDSQYSLKTAEDLEDQIGEFVVIEDTIQKVANIKNNAFLNFGNDWKTDFTVMLTSDKRRKLSQNGLNPQMLAKQKIRVRGWLREYNGPLIELEDISHLQIITNPSNLSDDIKEEL